VREDWETEATLSPHLWTPHTGPHGGPGLSPLPLAGIRALCEEWCGGEEDKIGKLKVRRESKMEERREGF
jgi:hypothetical protein